MGKGYFDERMKDDMTYPRYNQNIIIPPQPTSSILLAVYPQPQKQSCESGKEPAAKVDFEYP